MSHNPPQAIISTGGARPFTASQRSWTGNHVVSLSQFSREALAHLCGAADAARAVVTARGGCDVLRRRVLANVFLEPSTRTSSSFASAMQRLGGSVLQVSEATSSAAKGESLADTARSMLCYADALVLRSAVVGSAAQASAVCGGGKPFLNAGDGVGEHPTQALLDLYTILCEQRRADASSRARARAAATAAAAAAGSNAAAAAAGGAAAPPPPPPAPAPAAIFSASSPDGDAHGAAGAALDGVDGLTVTLVGDLKHGRTVHSLARLLALFRVRLVYVSPPELGMPADVQALVAAAGHGATQESAPELDAALLARTDVLYVTRVQKERFANAGEYERLKLAFVVTPATLALCKPSCVLMHPLPRVGEIEEACDSDPRAAYFRQMEACVLRAHARARARARARRPRASESQEREQEARKHMRTSAPRAPSRLHRPHARLNLEHPRPAGACTCAWRCWRCFSASRASASSLRRGALMTALTGSDDSGAVCSGTRICVHVRVRARAHARLRRVRVCIAALARDAARIGVHPRRRITASRCLRAL
jgi:aspartate carbamoyltransferase catalytic subunit